MQLIILSLPTQFCVGNGHQNSRKGQRAATRHEIFHYLEKHRNKANTLFLTSYSIHIHENNANTESKKIREL